MTHKASHDKWEQLKIRETNRYAYYAEAQFYVFYLCFVVLPVRHKNAVYVKLFHFLFRFF